MTRLRQLRRYLRGQPVPVLLALSGWVVLLITVAGHGPVRSVAVFGFVLVAPGLALVRLLPLRDRLEQLVLAVALGLSLATLIAEGFTIAHLLRPDAVLAVLAALCSAAAITEIVRAARGPARGRDE